MKLYITGIAQGVSPIRWSYQDVATPYIGSLGGGDTLTGDGYQDIVFHFDTQTAVTKLGLAGHMGEIIPLIIRGNLNPAAGALRIQGQDYIWILRKQTLIVKIFPNSFFLIRETQSANFKNRTQPR